MADKITFRLFGAEKMAREIEKSVARFMAAVGAGAYAVANNIAADGKRQTPVDTGALVGSWYVTMPERIAMQVVVEMGVGGPARKYAVPVHERTEVRHEVGNAKFLERPIDAASGTAANDIRRFAARAFEAGIGAQRGPFPTTPG